jgi:hypothetical protein
MSPVDKVKNPSKKRGLKPYMLTTTFLISKEIIKKFPFNL